MIQAAKQLKYIWHKALRFVGVDTDRGVNHSIDKPPHGSLLAIPGCSKDKYLLLVVLSAQATTHNVKVEVEEAQTDRKVPMKYEPSRQNETLVTKK